MITETVLKLKTLESLQLQRFTGSFVATDICDRLISAAIGHVTTFNNHKIKPHKLVAVAERLKFVSTEQKLSQCAALAAWSALSEPGEAVAVAFTDQFTPAGALSLVLSELDPSEFIELVLSFGDNTEMLALPQKTIVKSLEVWRTRLQQKNVIETVTECFRYAIMHDIKIISKYHSDYPQNLYELGMNQPLMLWARGSAEILHEKLLGVVGSRSVSSYGSMVTAELCAQAISGGYKILSGGAYGVDIIAHRTALAHNCPTVVVLAGGVDSCYPRSHANIFDAVIKNHGVVVSEMAPGAAPTRWRFLQRNRLIAALSSGLLVTEAGSRSGSINTAGHAAALGRTVAAVPGNIDTTYARGCHKLIKEYGAEIVSDMSALAGIFGFKDFQLELVGGADRELSMHTRILDAIPRRAAIDLNRIVAKTGIARADCESALAELVLIGRLQQTYKNGALVWQTG